MTPSQLVVFLRDCSSSSLGDFLLARLNREKQLRKNLDSILSEMIENRAAVEMASLLRSQEWQREEGKFSLQNAATPKRVDALGCNQNRRKAAR